MNKLMKEKLDSELTDYLDNFNKYTPEAITLAVHELKRRGRNFTDEEENDIKQKIQKSSDDEKDTGNLFSGGSAWKKNIVLDKAAPLLYSHGAIWGFSVLFTVIFGTVLLASNIKELKKKWIVIVIGILYTTISIAILSQIPRNIFATFLLNIAGGIGLTTTFWDKYIGKQTKYRTKPIWMPLTIAILVTALILFFFIYGH